MRRDFLSAGALEAAPRGRYLLRLSSSALLARARVYGSVSTGAVGLGARQEVNLNQVCENSTYRIYHLRVRMVTP